MKCEATGAPSALPHCLGAWHTCGLQLQCQSVKGVLGTLKGHSLWVSTEYKIIQGGRCFVVTKGDMIEQMEKACALREAENLVTWGVMGKGGRGVPDFWLCTGVDAVSLHSDGEYQGRLESSCLSHSRVPPSSSALYL